MSQMSHCINFKDSIQPCKKNSKQLIQSSHLSYKKPISFPIKPIDQQAKQKYLKQLQTIQKSIRKIMNNRQMSLESNKFNQSRRKRRCKQMPSSFLVKSITLTGKTNQNFNKNKENQFKQKQAQSLKRQSNNRKTFQFSNKVNENLNIFSNKKIYQNRQKLYISCSSILPKKDQQLNLRSDQNKNLEYTINKKIQIKLKKYNQEQNLLVKLHQITPIKYLSDKKFRAFVGNGNNSTLVKQTLKQRWWWQIAEQKKQVQFIWSQLKDKQYFNNYQKKQGFVHNHFSKNQYLGNKKTLYYLMRDYYKNIEKQVFDYLPLTFHIVSLKDHQWPKFNKVYKQEHENNNNLSENKRQKILWILKPGENSNRGNGIKICEKLQQIQQIIKQSQNLTHQERRKQSFIIQKYISKPFLYNRRKFDIRCYMLLVKIGKSVKGYWCKEGYIRTSGKYFDLNNYQDNFIHLTNDAIQAHSTNYGQHQQGNKLSIGTFQKYLDANYPLQYNFMQQVYPKLKKIAQDSIKASIYSIGIENNSSVFQLFGLDFMIDENFKPWLIEINTNPCLQTSCPVLKSIIPKVLDDCFKLSLDVLYPSPECSNSNNKAHLIPETQHLFQLVFDSNQYCKKKATQRA